MASPLGTSGADKQGYGDLTANANRALASPQGSRSGTSTEEVIDEKKEKLSDQESVSLRESVNSSGGGDDGDDDDDDDSRSSSSRRRGKKREPHGRSRSLLSRPLSHRRSRTQSRPCSLADAGPPVTRTVSEVRDGVLFHRDVEIDDIVREEEGERAGVSSPNSIRRVDLEKGQGSGVFQASGSGGGGDVAPEGAAQEEPDPNLVKWDGPQDPDNPKNWILGKKWAAVFVVSLFTLISPVSSSMIAPALPDIGHDLGISNTVELYLTMSIFLLAYAIGPLFMGPLSEVYGRVIVLQLSNLLYLFFNLGCGFSKTRIQMIVFRFLSGLGGSAPLAIGGGVLGDLFTAEQRGRALSMYSLAPLLGPAIGPIAGAFVTQNTTWRWIFHATSIVDALIQVGGMFFLRETYAPVLLRWKRNRLRKETGNMALYTAFDRDGSDNVLASLSRAFSRPFIMLGSQPIVQVLALYMMYLYGILYLQLAAFPTLWEDQYHESTGIAGLNYIALGIGLAMGAQILAPLQDRIYAHLKRRYNVTVGRPEFRVPIMIPGAVLVPVGLLIYGWCAEYHTHWVGPDIGILLLSAGTIVGFQCIQGYLVDTYTLYAASAVAATTVMRSLAGFGFPLFASKLFEKLGYGKGNTLLAAIGIVVGWPAPFLLWKYGPYLRTKKASFQG